jgi:hypothetical protein
MHNPPLHSNSIALSAAFGFVSSLLWKENDDGGARAKAVVLVVVRRSLSTSVSLLAAFLLLSPGMKLFSRAIPC